jgi:hypothetical protein
MAPGGTVLFKKLFQLLVLGGAVVATTSGCVPSADAQTASKKDGKRDGGSAASAPDAGMRRNASGGGAKTW